MKKRLLALSCCLLLAMGALVGCGKNGDDTKLPEKQPSVADIMTTILASVTETGGMNDVSQEAFIQEQFQVEGLEEWTLYMNMMNIRTDEIGIFKAADLEKVPAIKEAIQNHVQAKIDGWMPGYMPQEIDKMEKYVILEKGNYVLFAIASEGDQKIIAEKFEAALQ